MKVATNLMKITDPESADIRAQEILDEPKFNVGFPMYDRYDDKPAFQKLKKKPKLQKVRRKR